MGSAAAVKAQTIAAKEASAVGIKWAFAPMLDIARDPRWGRMVEGAGEDPYLGSAMAAAQVRGFQGEYIGSPDHILACMKHFAGYGAAIGGRDYDEAYIPETLLLQCLPQAVSRRRKSRHRIGHERLSRFERCAHHGQSLAAS